MHKKSNRVEILCFGMLRDLMGDRIELDVTGPLTEQSIKHAIATKHPELRDLSAIRVACNAQLVADAHAPMDDGDEIALIPPVSGG